MTKRKGRRTSVIEMDAVAAKTFFLKNSSYSNIDLPYYFDFEPMLSKIDGLLKGKRLSDFIDGDPSDFEKVNHVLFANKDGQHSWRKLELINPAIYVSLVNIITEPDNWHLLQTRWKEFYTEPNIKPLGMPVEANIANRKDKGENILHWWEEVEQHSIQYALDYQVLTHTDISDCYAQMYTHSIAWAIHGKTFAKENRRNEKLLGNVIDSHIRYTHYGQSNGLPQGSVLMDFLAEFILGYMDKLLVERLIKNYAHSKLDNYLILRYRDDYRIFTNDKYSAYIILKELSEVAADFGLRLNANKTKHYDDIIIGSIKEDKMEWQKTCINKNISKHILTIYKHSFKYPNSGSVLTALSDYYNRIEKYKKYYDSYTLISILANMTIHNPKAIPIISGIISLIINKKIKGGQKRLIIDSVHDKLMQTPNNTFFEIWIQRIALPNKIRYSCELPLCQAADGRKGQIWEMGWSKGNTLSDIVGGKIVNSRIRRSIPKVIPPSEFSPFQY